MLLDLYHHSIMLQQCIEGLNIKPDGVYVDCTFGGGGHSKAILEKLNTHAKLFAFDQDEDAQKNLDTLTQDKRFFFIPHNFCYLKNFLKLNGIEKVDGILADLGVSSYQIDTPQRGFSVRFDDAILDMRMDKRTTVSAVEVINKYPKDKLADVLYHYGDLTNSRYLAEAIVEFRKKKKIDNLDILKEAIKKKLRGHEIKTLTKIFQAIRIEVNNELEALTEMLMQSKEMLNTGGRLVVLSFHSLEDRIVKRFMKNELFEDGQIYFDMLTKKPLEATDEEIKNNKRSKSAKLRIAQKV